MFPRPINLTASSAASSPGRRAGRAASRCSVLIAAVVMGAAGLQAQSWKGTTNTNWNNSNNWTGTFPNSASATATFDSNFTGANQPTVNVPISLGEIDFAASLTKATTLSQSGTGALTIAGLSAIGIDNLSSRTIAINVPITLGGNQTWEGNTFSVSGAITNAGHTLTLSPNSGNALNLSGGISGTGGLTQTAGNVTLSGSNSYSGGTAVNGGTLTASASGAISTATAVTVASGASVALTGSSNQTGLTKTLTLTGTGVGGAGALQNVSGSNSWEGNISLSGSTTISSAANSLLYLGHNTPGSNSTNTISLGTNTLTFDVTGAGVVPTYQVFSGYTYAPTNVMINSSISGTGGLTVTGGGTVTLMTYNTTQDSAGVPNSFSGATAVNQGTLIVSGTNNTDVLSSSSVTVGTSSSTYTGAAAATLQLGQTSTEGSSNVIGAYLTGGGTATNLTIYSNGQFVMDGASNGFQNLTLQGGQINQAPTGANALLTLTGGVTTTASAQTAVITGGNVAMSANSFTFNVATGTTSSGIDLKMDSVLQNGVGFTGTTSSTSFVKTGTGTMELSQANTYDGVTDIQQGIINVQYGTASSNGYTGLGLQSNSLGSTTNEVIVETGAQLQLQGSIDLEQKTLVINGNGTSSNGALANVSGNNTWDGFVSLGSASTVQSNSGSLTIGDTSAYIGDTVVNAASSSTVLTVTGSGNTVIDGGVGNNISNVIKTGSGSLTLAGSDGYSGTVEAQAGAVIITNNNSLAGAGAAVTSGAALQIEQNYAGANVTETAATVAINGTGIGNNGAIENVNGTNTLTGNITLGSASRINADSGSTLTLSGHITGAQNLTLGGAGNIAVTGAIQTGSATLTKDGTGTATLSGANTYTGLTTVSAGTLAFGASNTVGTSNAFQINTSAILSVGNFTQSISSIGGTGEILFGSSTSLSQLTLNTSSTFSGSFAGTGTLTIGTGVTLTLGANFNDTGLNIVVNGGTLNINGTNDVFGTLTIEGSSVLNFASPATSDVEFTNVLANTGAALAVQNWTFETDYFYSAAQTPSTQGQAPLNQIVFTGYTGSNTIYDTNQSNNVGDDAGVSQIRPVIPEPRTYGFILVGACIAGLMIRGRFSRRARA